MENRKTRKMVYMALLIAIAIVLHITETAIQLPLPFGMKLGFANVISLIVIEIYGMKEMFVLNFFRVLISSLLTGAFLSYPFFVSCGGVLFSSLILVLCKYMRCFSIVSMSVISAIFHNIGQVIVVSYVVSSKSVIVFLGVLLLFGAITGILTGMIAGEILKRIRKHVFNFI